MKRKNLFLSLCIVTCNLSMVVNAQAVRVFNDPIDGGRTELTKAAIFYKGTGDALDVVAPGPGGGPAVLGSGSDLIWGAFNEYQPNNPGILALTKYPWTGAFIVRSDGKVGISNSNPSVTLEVGSSGSIHQVKVNGTIVHGSDARMKENIKDLSNSLGKLKQLRSVSYNFKELEIEEPILEKYLKDGVTVEQIRAARKNAQKNNAELLSRTVYGFLAQDVEKLFPDLVYKDSAGMLSVDYIGMIPLLLDGLQDQQMQIEKQQQQIDEQRELINQLIKAMGEKPVLKSAIDPTPLLMQNTPNPFNQKTEIGYYIPENVSNANIYIYDMNGFQQKAISIAERGNGLTTVQASSLQAGIYFYTLVCDGKPVDTKQMILTR